MLEAYFFCRFLRLDLRIGGFTVPRGSYDCFLRTHLCDKWPRSSRERRLWLCFALFWHSRHIFFVKFDNLNCETYCHMGWWGIVPFELCLAISDLTIFPRLLNANSWYRFDSRSAFCDMNNNRKCVFYALVDIPPNPITLSLTQGSTWHKNGIGS